MLACDWVGILVLALDDADRLLDALLELAVLALEVALDDRCLADVLEQLVVPGKFGFEFDQVTLSARAAFTAFHSFSATTASRSLIQTALAPAIWLDRASSTFTGTAPATVGRIMRACSMPGRRTSLTISSVPNTLPGRSLRGSDWPMILKSAGFFSGAGTSTWKPLLNRPFHFTVLSR